MTTADNLADAAKDSGSGSQNIDPQEVERFGALAGKWWDPNGEFRPLHKIGAARLAFIRNAVTGHFLIDDDKIRAFSGLRMLDTGCGGGLVCEPLARLGANVTGIDPAEESVAVAKVHAQSQGLEIDYRAERIEDVARRGELFDVTLSLEVIEHVPDPAAFIASCAQTVRPGGLLIVSTINRTMKAYGLAIVAAEQILRWLPAGTHQWDRFVTPEELGKMFADCELENPRFEGLVLDPLRDRWSVGSDTDVNYIASVEKPDLAG